MAEFTVKDSGERHQFDGGGQRDTEEGKLDYTLVYDGPMFERWVEHLNKGAEKYEPRNWMQFTGEEPFQRATRSLARHYHQYIRGDIDEDHAAAIFFNINVREYLKDKTPGLEGPGAVIQWNLSAWPTN